MTPRSLVDNTADAEQVKRGQFLEKERERRYRLALTALANTPDGEVLFERIAERAAFFTTSFARDPYETAFNEGRRSLGLAFLADWTLARPDALAAMLAARATEENRENG